MKLIPTITRVAIVFLALTGSAFGQTRRVRRAEAIQPSAPAPVPMHASGPTNRPTNGLAYTVIGSSIGVMATGLVGLIGGAVVMVGETQSENMLVPGLVMIAGGVAFGTGVRFLLYGMHRRVRSVAWNGGVMPTANGAIVMFGVNF